MRRSRPLPTPSRSWPAAGRTSGSTLVTPRGFFAGRIQSIYVARRQPRHRRRLRRPALVGDSGRSCGGSLPFAVSPPPAQPDRFATDWSRIAIDAADPVPRDPRATRSRFLLADRAGGLDGNAENPREGSARPRRPLRRAAVQVDREHRRRRTSSRISRRRSWPAIVRAREGATRSGRTGTTTIPCRRGDRRRTSERSSPRVVADGRHRGRRDLGGSPRLQSEPARSSIPAYFIAVASDPALAARESARRWFARHRRRSSSAVPLKPASSIPIALRATSGCERDDEDAQARCEH